MNLKTKIAATAFALLAAGGTAEAQSITVYSAGPADLINQLAAGYTAQTGVDVNVYQATTGEILARLEAETTNPVADIFISASWADATDFATRGLLVPYASPNAANVPDFLKSDTAVAEGVSALAIAWNPASGTPRPTDWSDLLRPEFKDLVTMPDPSLSGSSFELVAALHAAAGDWSLFEGLHDNGLVLAQANAQALNPVLQGAKAAVFGAVDYTSLAQQAAGESIEVIFPSSGTVVAPRPMMIFNWSQHIDQAEAFIDYVLSDEGQAAVAAAYLMPARTDIPANRPLISDLTILQYDTDAVYAARDTTLADFATAVGQ